jgi:hypothetical protein
MFLKVKRSITAGYKLHDVKIQHHNKAAKNGAWLHLLC